MAVPDPRRRDTAEGPTRRLEVSAFRGGAVRPGQQVGPFTVLRLLARGSSSEVYVARDRDGERLALKVLDPRPFLEDASLGERFRREGALLERLRHPCVVAIRGRGHDPALRRPWLALELATGADLRQHLAARAGQRLPAAEARPILACCARALAAAHRLGIVHRDVKPGNLILVGPGRAKLTDFGIALSAGSARLTSRDELVGTPAFMAPEVFAHGAWTPAADAYALGVLTFLVLTGETPFTGQLPALVRAHLCAAPPDVAERAPVPPRLAQLVRRLLAKDPDRRPTLAEAAVELGEDEPVEPASARAPLVAARERGAGHHPRPDPAPRLAPLRTALARLFSSSRAAS